MSNNKKWNKNGEFVSKCRHIFKFAIKLSNLFYQHFDDMLLKLFLTDNKIAYYVISKAT